VKGTEQVKAATLAIAVAAALAVSPCGSARAAPPPAPAPPTASAATEPAELMLSNRLVFTFRAELIGYSPEARAKAAGERIEDILEAGEKGDVGSTPLENGIAVSIGKKLAFVVTPGDVDELAGETLDQVAAAAQHNLAQALAEARELKRPALLLRGGGLAAAATAVFVAVLLGLRWLHRRLEGWLTAQTRLRAGKLVVRGFAPLAGVDARMLARLVLGPVRWGLAIFACYLWLAFLLERFPYTRPWGEQLGGFLLRSLETILLKVVSGLPGLATAVLIFVLARALVGLVRVVFNGIDQGRIDVSAAVRETSQPTRRIVMAAIWLFALVMAYPYLPGSGSDAFKGVSVFIGLMVTLGGSSMFGQAVSGLVLMYSRSLKPGDYVRIDEHEGTVTSLGMLATKLRTTKDEEVSVPNSLLLGTVTKNFSRLAGEQGVILYTTVTIGYDAPWRQVHAMLLMAAERTPGLRKQPPPFVWQSALSDYYVEYQLNARLERPEERQPTMAALHANIQDVFNEYGVQIMSPHFMANPPDKVWVPRERWSEPPAQGPAPHPGPAPDADRG
jgi:small-conductance mechanosensitive channel